MRQGIVGLANPNPIDIIEEYTTMRIIPLVYKLTLGSAEEGVVGKRNNPAEKRNAPRMDAPCFPMALMTLGETNTCMQTNTTEVPVKK
jgi:hypothetical protein